MPFERIIFRVHALQRMFEREISRTEVFEVLSRGEVIENYPEDTPYPSYLLLGFAQDRPLHIVVADNQKAKETIIITVYEPDPKIWDEGFKGRKK